MKQQLILDRQAAKIGGTRFLLRYGNNYIDPADPRIDGSHIHDCYEFYLNLSGDVSFFVNNRMYKIKRGDVIFTHPGDMHFCVYHMPVRHEYFCLWINADESTAIGEFLEKSFHEYFYSFGEDGELSDILFEMMKMQREENVLAETEALLRFLLLAGEKKEGAHSPVPSTLPPDMQRIVDDLNESFADIKTVKDIAQRHYISPATLNRRFKQYMQMSPHTFLEEKKLAYAKQLLMGGASVTDACFGAGFSDSSHFIAVFKKKFGKTPFRYKGNKA